MSEKRDNQNRVGRDAFERDIATDLDSDTPDKPKGMPLHTKILIGLVVGVIAGVAVNRLVGGDDPRVVWVVDNITHPVGQLFLRLLLMIVVPLVFSSLVVGVAGIGDIRKLGRVGLKTLAYTIIISAISVAIGLTLANTIQPGRRVDPTTASALQQRYSSDATKRVEDAKKAEATKDSALMTVVKTLIPSNPIASIAGIKPGAATQSDTPDMLHLMFFSVLLGVAATLIPTSVSGPFLRGLDALFEICAKIIDIIMKLAPFAVACLLFNNTARFGLDLLQALGWFVITVLLGLSLHMFGVYSLSVAILSRLSPIDFFRRIKTVILTAVSTAWSKATRPPACRVSAQTLGGPQEIQGCVMTVGAPADQSGTAVYGGVTVSFVAQLAGVPPSLGMQLMVVYLAILGGSGTAGVP